MTKTERSAIVAKIEARTNYDVSTLRIAKDGTMTARLDSDKTFAGYDPKRYVVGNVRDFSDPRSDICDIEAFFE